MIKIIFIFALTGLAVSQSPCPFAQVYGQCITAECQAQIYRLSMTPSLQNPNQGNLVLAVQQAITFDPATGYEITFAYTDNGAQKLLFDKTKCLSTALYFTKDEYAINSTRLNVATVEAVPTVPTQLVDSFVDSPGVTYLKTKITQAQMESNCLKVVSGTQLQYTCNMELAFKLFTITQSSFFTQFRTFVDTAVGASSTKLDFKQTVQVAKCPGDQVELDSNCKVKIVMNSKFSFCSDSVCSVATDTAPKSYAVGQSFYVRHQITDPQFATWLLKSPKATISAVGYYYSVSFPSTEATTLNWAVASQAPGTNIYKLTVPSVQGNVTISVAAASASSRRMLIDEATEAGYVSQQFEFQVQDDDSTNGKTISFGIFLIVALVSIIM